MDPVLGAYLRIQAVTAVTMFFHRLAFFTWYGEPGLVSAHWTDLLKAFWLGLRFDLSILVYANSLPILLYFIVLRFPRESTWKAWKSFAIVYWSIIFVVIQVLGTLDFFYYMHFQDRFNVVMVGFFTDDTRALVSTIWKNYPFGWGLMAFVLLGIVGYRLTRHWVKDLSAPSRFSWRAVGPTAIMVLALSLVIGRGSFTFYPLGLIHTQVSVNPFINLITVNAPFRIKTALKQYFQSRNAKRANIKAYGFEGREADAFLLSHGSFVNGSAIDTLSYKPRRLQKSDPHVVIVLMESLGSYWFQFQSPEFDLVGPLRNELKEAVFTPKMVPGAAGTIGSLAAILSGVPAGAKSAILSESPYQNLRMPTSPAIFFNNRGYNTRFVYGGNLGWRGVGAFAERQGFHDTDGEVEIEKEMGKLEGSTHDWGVFDDRLFNYVLHVLDKATKPEFIIIMTTSNHPPFETPKSYTAPNLVTPQALKENLLVDESVYMPRFVSTRFANDALYNFRRQMKEKGLSSKSAVAVTGDHGFWLARIPSDQVARRFLVPFILWLPNENLKERAEKRLAGSYISHLHILPTLYDLVQTKAQPHYSFLPSIFGEQKLVGYSSQAFALFPDLAINLDSREIGRCYKEIEGQLPELITCAAPSEAAQNTKTFKAFMATTDFFLEAIK